MLDIMEEFLIGEKVLVFPKGRFSSKYEKDTSKAIECLKMGRIIGY